MLFQTGNLDHILVCPLEKIKSVLDPGPELDPYSGGCDLAELFKSLIANYNAEVATVLGPGSDTVGIRGLADEAVVNKVDKNPGQKLLYKNIHFGPWIGIRI